MGVTERERGEEREPGEEGEPSSGGGSEEGSASTAPSSNASEGGSGPEAAKSLSGRATLVLALLGVGALVLLAWPWGATPTPSSPTLRPPAADAAQAPETATPSAASGLGIVEGEIVLAEGAALPSYAPEEIGRLPTAAELPASCSPPQLQDRSPVTLVEGRLAGIVVAATGDPVLFGAALGAPIAREHQLRIEDCRLSPRVLTATRGDRLVITNAGEHPFLPTLGTSAFMQALLAGERREIPLDRGGVLPLTCNFGSPCGRTDVAIFYHQAHGISGEDGRFRLSNVPAGGEVRIHAWHPLFEEGNATVRVEAGETIQLRIELRPDRRRLSPAPAAGSDGGSEPPGPF